MQEPVTPTLAQGSDRPLVQDMPLDKKAPSFLSSAVPHEPEATKCGLRANQDCLSIERKLGAMPSRVKPYAKSAI